MYSIKFSENISKLRHEKKITQEQLAEFLGVTKASVSKWETGQSIPDVLMLPWLATFFDVTIDDLLGYEPQLSKEQMVKIYKDLCSAFVQEPFEQVMEKSKKLVHQYYSCYLFLYKICFLWINHYMLATEEETQRKILLDALELCSHIDKNCKEIALCSDAIYLKANIRLLLGDVKQVIEELEDIQSPLRLSNQSKTLLIKAYEMEQNIEKADEYTQITMYTLILELVGCAIEYIIIHSNELEVCKETIRRIGKIAEAYDLEHLHPNIISVFYYQAAIVYCMHEKKEDGLCLLKKFVTCIDVTFENENLSLHGDDYFTKLEGWFEQTDLSGDVPREKKVILESAIQGMEHPAFQILQEEEQYKHMKEILRKRGQELC